MARDRVRPPQGAVPVPGGSRVRPWLGAVGAAAGLVVVAAPLSAQEPQRDVGERIFVAQCARCHGIGGTGGEGPTLQGRRFRTVADEEAIVSVIQNGLGGMPGMWIGDTEARRVAAYVWSLARTEPEPVPGDAARGRALFTGKGACASCHIVAGQGAGLGPELTDVGARRAPGFLRRALVAPGDELPEGRLSPHASFLVVSATTVDGRRVEGVRVWEDAFMLQLRDGDGAYHALAKEALTSFERRFGASLMPDYAALLSEEEITDLVAYLAALRGKG